MLDHLQEVVRHAAGLAPGEIFRRSDWTRACFVYVLPAWLPDDALNAASWALEDAIKPCWLLVRVERNVYGTYGWRPCFAPCRFSSRPALTGWHFDEARGHAGIWTSPDEVARQALGGMFGWVPFERLNPDRYHRSGGRRSTNKNRRRHRNPNVRRDHDPEAYAAGLDARVSGQQLSANPYQKGTTAHREWSRGWRKR